MSDTTFRGNPIGLRYAGYFVLFIGTLFGLAALRIASQEYRAQHAWPVASGEVLSAEEGVRVDRSMRGGDSTAYWTKFTVLFDPPLNQCGPGMLWTIIGGPTRCIGHFNTLEGSREDAYRWTRRHPAGSQVHVHYEPRGAGLRFVEDSIVDIYPWKKVFVTFVIFVVGSGLLRLARWLEKNQTESSPAASQDAEDAQGSDELIDLNLR